MLSSVMRMLEGLNEQVRESVIRSLELRLGHSLEEAAEYERAFIEQELRALLWIETEDDSYVTQPQRCEPERLHKTAERGTCSSCNEKGSIFENGCSRCLFCGFGTCDV